MSNATITLTGDASQLLKEYDKVAKAKDKQFIVAKQLKDAYKQISDSADKLGKSAKSALDASTTATERYRQTMAELRAALDAGVISEEKYTRARAVAIQSFRVATGAVDAHNASQKEAQSIIERVTTAEERHAQEVAKLNRLRTEGLLTELHYTRALAAADERLKAVTTDTRAADDAQQEWNNSAREGESISARLATAEERHAAELARLNRLWKDGALSGLDYMRAMQAADAKLKEATTDTTALAAAEREEAKAQNEAAQMTDRNKTAKERYTEGTRAAKKALDDGRITLETYNREMKRLQDSLDEKPKGFAAWAAGLAKVAAGYLAIKEVLKAVNQEMEDNSRLNKEAARGQKSYAEKSREMRDNFKDDATMSLSDLDPTVKSISKEVGVDAEVVVDVMGPSLQQKGTLTNRQVADAVKQSLRYSRTDTGKAIELAQRGLLLANKTGIKDLKSVMGFLAEASNATSMSSIEKFGATGARAINDLVLMNESPERAAETFATINSMMGDFDGSRSATATLQLASQLMDYVPSAKGSDARGKFSIPKAEREAFEKAVSPVDRLEVMQRSPALRRAFISSTSYETAAKTSIYKLLAADQSAMKIAGVVRDAIPALDETLGPSFDKEIAKLDSGSVAQNAIALQAGAALIQREKLVNEKGGRAGTAEELLFSEQDGVLSNNDLSGLNGPARWMARKEFQLKQYAGYTPEEAGISVLQNQIKARSRDPLWTSQQRAEADQPLYEMIGILKQLRDATVKGNADAEAERKAPQQPLFGIDPALQGGRNL